MVHLDVVHRCNATLVNRQSLVAVFVGGTQGIGEYSIRALTTAYGAAGKGLRIYIVGRKEKNAEKIIADCLQICPAGQFQFIRAENAAVLKDVDRVCAEIMKAETVLVEKMASGAPKIDLLVMTQGCLVFERQDTPEGLDTLMSLLYYSRMRFIIKLLPLLLAAAPGPAHIVSVFSPKRDDKIFTDDLSLRDPKHYNFMNMGSHVSYMTTFFMEQLAAKYPEQLSLIHYFPGLVITQGFKDPNLPRWLRWLFVVALPLARPLTVPKEESGARVIFHASRRFPARSKNNSGDAPMIEEGDDLKDIKRATSSDGVVGGGAYRVDWNGETVPKGPIYEKLEKENMSQKVWDHTTEAFNTIDEGRVFAG